MTTRTLSRLSALLWLLACGWAVALAVDLQRPDAARAAVWAVALLHLGGALGLSRTVATRATVAEEDAAEWRAKWGGEVGPYKIALTRIVWAIEEARPNVHGRPARVDAPDLLLRAERIARGARSLGHP